MYIYIYICTYVHKVYVYLSIYLYVYMGYTATTVSLISIFGGISMKSTNRFGDPPIYGTPHTLW